MSRVRNPLVKGRMYKVTDGGSIKGIRFNKDGTTDVLVVPGSKRNPRKKKNESYRKTKKRVRKAQRSGALDRGPMYQKWRKARKISKTGRARNRKRAAKKKK